MLASQPADPFATLSPSQIAILLTPVSCDPPPASPKASRLHDHGLTSKSVACDECGKIVTLNRCAKSHVWRQGRSCNERMCKACAARIRNERLYKLSPVIEVLSAARDPLLPRTFTFLSLYSPVPCDRQHISEWSASLSRRFRKLAAGSPHRIYIHLSGYIGDNLVTYVLYWGTEHSPDTFRRAFPDAMVHATCRENDQIGAYFEDLLRYTIPHDTVRQADVEFAFHGLRQYKVLGTALEDEIAAASERLFTMHENPIVNNLTTTDPGDPDAPKKRPCRCPRCGLPPVETTGPIPYAMILDPKHPPPWHKVNRTG